MRSIGRAILFLIKAYSNYGILFFVSLIYPVYFIQDTNMRNRGYDILSLKEHPKHYWRGIYWKNPYWKFQNP